MKMVNAKAAFFLTNGPELGIEIWTDASVDRFSVLFCGVCIVFEALPGDRLFEGRLLRAFRAGLRQMPL